MIYGVVTKGEHIDVSRTELGAKRYASANGFEEISVRKDGNSIARVIAKSFRGRWIKADKIVSHHA